jgi:hypothetical protein
MSTTASCATAHRFQIRFPSVSTHGHSMAFPCDAEGNVDLDGLSDESRCDYLFARIMMRRECASPEVVPC